MPGQTPPAEGIQGVWARFLALSQRLASLEAWQRTVVSIPAGTITRWPGSTPPPGALQCNGAAFSGTQYPALAAALGSTTLPTVTGTPIYIIWT